MHTERFWRENAKLVEQDNFKALRALIALLSSKDVVSCKLVIRIISSEIKLLLWSEGSKCMFFTFVIDFYVNPHLSV